MIVSFPAPKPNRVHELFQYCKALTDKQKADVLAFAFGWCEDNEEFAEGIENCLLLNFPEVF